MEDEPQSDNPSQSKPMADDSEPKEPDRSDSPPPPKCGDDVSDRRLEEEKPELAETAENVPSFQEGEGIDEKVSSLGEGENVDVFDDVMQDEKVAIGETMGECEGEEMVKVEVAEEMPEIAERDAFLDEGLVREDEKVDLLQEESAENEGKILGAEEGNEEKAQSVGKDVEDPLLLDALVDLDEKREESAKNEGKVALLKEENDELEQPVGKDDKVSLLQEESAENEGKISLVKEENDEMAQPVEKDCKVPLLQEESAEHDVKISVLKEENNGMSQPDEKDDKVPLLHEELAENEKVSLSKEVGNQMTQPVEEDDKVPLLQEGLVNEDEKVPLLQEELAENEGNVTLSEDEESADKDEKQEEDVEKDEEESSTDEKQEEDVDEAEEMDIDDGGPSMAAGKRTGSKRKRGRPGRLPVTQGRKPKAPPKLKEDEELCFICFDGGDLVVCDHRGCPKVYHPSCVNRDEDYFKGKGQWNCGWHICSNCQKSARYMCYTCTYSLCKRCIKDAEFVCVRGNKGFCETCKKMVMQIEMEKHGNEEKEEVDFDDKVSWLYLFKDYWVDLKAKLSLTLKEITSAKNPFKEANAVPRKEESLDNSDNANDDKMIHSTSTSGHHRERTSKHHNESASSRKKVRKRLRNTVKEVESASTSEDNKWASNELLEFVAHMKNGDRSALSRFDVQPLLLEYINQNNLRDPRRKGQVVCDLRLRALFGKSRVGHLEMLKLLEPHFLVKEASPLATDENQGGVVDPDPGQMDIEGNSDASTRRTSDSRTKLRRSGEKELTRFEDYAAIDVHNVSLMYLRRNLMEEMLDDTDMFSETVVGSFVRIRITNSSQSSKDTYRLVQVVGTGKAAAKYKIGQKITEITLEILNLDKREFITIDATSNQTFTEEECKRLRQSVKWRFICPLTVDAVHEKARALQTVRVNDWIESEKLKLGNLRDRASEKGRIKEHRECVEKLQRLNMPEEHERRLNEVPEVHVDPHMDPDYESADDEERNAKKNETDKNRFSKPSSNQRNEFSAWKNINTPQDSKRGIPKVEVVRDAVSSSSTQPGPSSVKSELFQIQGNPAYQVSTPETPKTMSDTTNVITGVPPQNGPQFQLANTVKSNTDETEKMWHYQDPSGKTQGPFTMIQLRKWSISGLFPASLRIWRTSEKQEDSILLTDALSGKFYKDSQLTNISTMAASSANNPQTGSKFPQDSYNNPPPKSDGWTAQQSQSNSTSTSRWESSNNSQTHSSPRPTAPFSRNSSRPPNYHGRDFRGDNNGRWSNNHGHQNNWNSNWGPRRFQHNGSRGNERQHPYRSPSSQQFPANNSSNQMGSGSFNQQPSNIDWASLQGAINRILPSSSPIQPMNSGPNNMIPLVSSVQPMSLGPCTIAPNLTTPLTNVVGGWAAPNSAPNVNPASIHDNVCVSSNNSNTAPNCETVSADALQSKSIRPANPQLNDLVHDPGKNNIPASENKTRTESGSASVSAPQQGQNVSNINPTQAGNMGWGMAPQISNPGTGIPQQIGNMVYTAMPGPANMGWGMLAQGVMNMAWGTPTNVNMGWGPPSQAPVNSNFAIPGQVNANMNTAWGGAQAQRNTNAGFGMPMQVAGQGSMNNMSATWDPSAGNPHTWNPQQQQQPPQPPQPPVPQSPQPSQQQQQRQSHLPQQQQQQQQQQAGDGHGFQDNASGESTNSGGGK